MRRIIFRLKVIGCEVVLYEKLGPGVVGVLEMLGDFPPSLDQFLDEVKTKMVADLMEFEYMETDRPIEEQAKYVN